MTAPYDSLLSLECQIFFHHPDESLQLLQLIDIPSADLAVMQQQFTDAKEAYENTTAYYAYSCMTTDLYSLLMRICWQHQLFRDFAM